MAQWIIFVPSSQTTSAGHLRGDWGDRQYQVGSAVVPHCHVDLLLLLYLERSQVCRKGIHVSPKAMVNVWTLKSLNGHHFVQVVYCYLPLCDVAHSFDPWTHSSWGSTRSAVLSLARSLTPSWSSGRHSVKYSDSTVFRWAHCCFVWTGLVGGWDSDLLFVQFGCGLSSCTRQL